MVNCFKELSSKKYLIEEGRSLKSQSYGACSFQLRIVDISRDWGGNSCQKGILLPDTDAYGFSTIIYSASLNVT